MNPLVKWWSHDPRWANQMFSPGNLNFEWGLEDQGDIPSNSGALRRLSLQSGDAPVLILQLLQIFALNSFTLLLTF